MHIFVTSTAVCLRQSLLDRPSNHDKASKGISGMLCHECGSGKSDKRSRSSASTFVPGLSPVITLSLPLNVGYLQLCRSKEGLLKHRHLLRERQTGKQKPIGSLRRLQRKKRRTVGREESGQTALSVVY